MRSHLSRHAAAKCERARVLPPRRPVRRKTPQIAGKLRTATEPGTSESRRRAGEHLFAWVHSLFVPASEKIVITGAREHNLKDVSVELPRDALIVITGLSGSGKSSLAFDTIYAEGQRRYVESLSSYARQFLGLMEKPDVDSIEGLSPAISIDQKTTSRNPRSTVGTVTEIYDYLRLLWARIGHPFCPECGEEITGQTQEQIVDRLMTIEDGTQIHGDGAGRPRAQRRIRQIARADAARGLLAGRGQRRAAPARRGDRPRQKIQTRHLDRGRPPGDETGAAAAALGVGRGRGRDRRRADRSRVRRRRRSRSCSSRSSSPASTAAPRSPSWSRGSSPSTRRTAPATAATGSASRR